MLAQRRRGRARGTAPGGDGAHNNGLISYGNNDAVNGAKLGGGYKSTAFFDYPQGVVNLTKIVQIAVGSGTPIMLDDEARVYTCANGETGMAGIGDANVEVFDPVQVTGGVYLYPQQDLTVAKTAWRQVRGPYGPRLPTKRDHEEGRSSWHVVAVDSAAAHCMALTSDGRVLCWGSGDQGALGNGWSSQGANDASRGKNEKEKGEYPQLAPWWAQTAGPAQSETGKSVGGKMLVSGAAGSPGAVWSYDQVVDATHPTGYGSGLGANILTGVKAMACAQGVSVVVKTNDEVWYAGQFSGGAPENVYFAKDTMWDPTNPAHLPAGYHVEAIVATKAGYLLLLSNGTASQNLTRYVGYVREYCGGDGKLESAKTNVRDICTPSTSAGVPFKGAIAIAKGEYALKFLKYDGTAWTCGSEARFQNGLGRNRWENVEYVTQITLSRKAIAIAADGEDVQGKTVPAPGIPAAGGPGINGADMTAILLNNNTVVGFGIGFNPSTGAGSRYEGIGSMGTGDSGHHPTPIAPLGSLQNITQIAVSPVQTLLVQDPGAPAAPTLRATSPAAGLMQVNFAPAPGPLGQLPNWRAPDGYEIKLTRSGFATVKVTILPGEPLERLFSGLAAGVWLVNVNELQTPVEPAFTSGLVWNPAGRGGLGAWSGTGTGGLLPVTWAAPAKAEPRLILEYHHAGTYLDGKGKPIEEDFIRLSPDPAGGALGYTIPIAPSSHGIAGETIEARLYGAFAGPSGKIEGNYNLRKRAVTVL